MKKGAIVVAIGIVVLALASYGHHKYNLNSEKVAAVNEVALMQQEIAGGNINGANNELTKIMESKYPLTKAEEESYSKQISEINPDQAKANSNMMIQEIIKTYMNINDISDMGGIQEASVNGVNFYEATEALAPNGKFENLNKVVKPTEIFDGIYGYKFSMEAINSKEDNYFYMSQSGVIYQWSDIISGVKNLTLKADIAKDYNNKASNINEFVGEYGPKGTDNIYKVWSSKGI